MGFVRGKPSLSSIAQIRARESMAAAKTSNLEKWGSD